MNKQLSIFLLAFFFSSLSSAVLAEEESGLALGENSTSFQVRSQGPWDWTINYGQIKRLYPTGGDKFGDRTFFSLKNGETAMNPSGGYYYIPKSNSNYQAMIDLLYLSAEHQWTVNVRTETSLDTYGHAKVVYLVVDR
jgi:hypothetical protein